MTDIDRNQRHRTPRGRWHAKHKAFSALCCRRAGDCVGTGAAKDDTFAARTPDFIRKGLKTMM